MSPSRQTARARWRRCFFGYAAILTTATHWPALEIGTEEVPAADKVLHFYAFAVLTAFLWKTEWIHSVRALLVAGLVWVIADELTQSLPILERQFSWLDVISSGLGVTIACAWIAAMQPRGGPANRARISAQQYVIDVVLGGPMRGTTLAAWLVLAALLAHIGLGFLFALPAVLARLPAFTPAIIYGSVQALLIGMFAILAEKLLRKARARVAVLNACPDCGRSANTDPGEGRPFCVNCGQPFLPGTWSQEVAPDSARLRRFLQWPAAIAICILGAGAAAFFLVIAAYSHYAGRRPAALRAARALHDLPDDFVLSVDLAVLLLALAAMAWVYRGNLARWHDRQHIECRRCGYDLRATPIVNGLGACPECGSAFAKLPADAQPG